MASSMLTGWPAAASVSVYARQSIPDHSRNGVAPSGSVVTSGTADSSGLVTVSGIAYDTDYVATDGVRVVGFREPSPSMGSRVTAEASANVSVTSPMLVPVQSGTFVAKSTSAPAAIDAMAGFDESGSSSLTWFLFYGPDAGSQLTPLHQGDALAVNVQKIRLGGGTGQKVPLSARPTLTGLTPGTTYRWELTCAITGGLIGLTVTSGPFAIAVSKNLTPFPEAASIVALKTSTDGKLHLFKAQGFKSVFEASEFGSVTLTGGATAGRVAITPDGTKAVVCQQGANNVAVVTTGALVQDTTNGTNSGGGYSPAVQGYYTPTGTGPAPTGVCVTADGLSAWVTLAGTGKLVKMSLADGTFGTQIDLGSTSSPQSVALSPDGSTLLVACAGTAGSGTLQKVDAATGSVTGSLSRPSAGAVAWDPTGADLAYVSGTTTVTKHKPSDMTTISTPSAQAIPANSQAIAVFPDGRSLLVGSNTTSSGQAIQHLRTDDLSRYVQFGSGPGSTASQGVFDLAIGPYGAIYTPSFVRNVLGIFPGGRVNVRVTGSGGHNADYFAETIRVAFDNAA